MMAIEAHFFFACVCVLALLIECCVAADEPYEVTNHIRRVVEADGSTLTRVEFAKPPDSLGGESLAMFQRRAELDFELQQRIENQHRQRTERQQAVIHNHVANQDSATNINDADLHSQSSELQPGIGVAVAQPIGYVSDLEDAATNQEVAAQTEEGTGLYSRSNVPPSATDVSLAQSSGFASGQGAKSKHAAKESEPKPQNRESTLWRYGSSDFSANGSSVGGLTAAKIPFSFLPFGTAGAFEQDRPLPRIEGDQYGVEDRRNSTVWGGNDRTNIGEARVAKTPFSFLPLDVAEVPGHGERPTPPLKLASAVVLEGGDEQTIDGESNSPKAPFSLLPLDVTAASGQDKQPTRMEGEQFAADDGRTKTFEIGNAHANDGESIAAKSPLSSVAIDVPKASGRQRVRARHEGEKHPAEDGSNSNVGFGDNHTIVGKSNAARVSLSTVPINDMVAPGQKMKVTRVQGEMHAVEEGSSSRFGEGDHHTNVEGSASPKPPFSLLEVDAAIASGQDKQLTRNGGSQYAVEDGSKSGDKNGGSSALQLNAELKTADNPTHAPQDVIYGMIVVVGVMTSAAAACCLQEFESQDKFDYVTPHQGERRASTKPVPPSAVIFSAAPVFTDPEPDAEHTAPLTGSKMGTVIEDVELLEGEICCRVDVAKLEQSSGIVDLCDVGGRPLVRVAKQVDMSTGREAIRFFTKEGESLGAIFGAEQDTNPNVLEVQGKSGEKFGEYKRDRGVFVLTRNGAEIFHVRLLATSTWLTIDAAETGERVSSVLKGQEGNLLVRVNPSSDLVLVLLCVFGALLFGALNAENEQ